MLGSEILEVAVGLIFVFLLVSSLVAALREGIESFFRARAAHLEYGIYTLLRQNNELTRALYEHPLVFGLYHGEYVDRNTPDREPGVFTFGGKLPSYIPANNFAKAILDIAARGPLTRAANVGSNAPRLSAETVRANIGNIGEPYVQRVILTALDDARDDLDRTRQNIEAWFDSAMDRVSGKYKRSSQKIIFSIALVIAITLNIDAIRIGNFLYHDDVARAALMARAEVARTDTTGLNRSYAEALDSLRATPVPMGGITERKYEGVRDFLVAVLGWLTIAFAATLGAPFWFDLLNKVMVIRSTVKPREKSPEEGSEDRRPKHATNLNVDVATTGAEAGTPSASAAPVVPADASLHYFDEDGEGCGIEADSFTLDEELPAAKGGVA